MANVTVVSRPANGRHEDESLGELFTRLLDDAKGFVRAEMAWAKTVATDRLGRAGVAIGLAAGALVIALSAVTALMVGLIMTLATEVGPGWATLIVVLAALAIAGVLGWLALGRFKTAMAPVPTP